MGDEVLSRSITSQEQYQMCYESIAKAFPETRNKYPWFPDRPKLFLSAMGGGNSHLLSFCFWNDEHLHIFLDTMKGYIELGLLDNKESRDTFHSTFETIITHVWMIDCILDKLEEENLYPCLIIDIRNKMHRLLNDAIKVVVQGDSIWLGDHADWWVPAEYVKRRENLQSRNKK